MNKVETKVLESIIFNYIELSIKKLSEKDIVNSAQMKIFTSLILVFFIYMNSLQSQCSCSRPDNLSITKRTKSERLSQLAKSKTAEQMVDEQLQLISESLELDPFEEAVVKTSLINLVRKRREIEILKLEQNKMQEELEKIYKQWHTELKDGLSKKKYDAFVALQEQPSKKKKKKRT